MTIKRIENHTDRELDDAIKEATSVFGPHFWTMLHGIDAYLERRNRRRAKRTPNNQPPSADLIARIEAVEREVWYNIGRHK